MRQRLIWDRCAVCGAGVLFIATLFGCEQANQYREPPPPEVSIAQPVQQSVNEYLEFTGTTEAINRVEIRARVNGYLKNIEFQDGATVEEGTLLFVIEPEPFEAALAVAEASLQRAEASLKLAEAELRRTEPLVQRSALPQQELDLKQADVATANADVAAAKAAVTQAKLNLNYTRVIAPISGRVGRHLVDVGNLVRAESTLLTVIESYNPIYAHFNMSEGDLLRLMQEEAGSANEASAQELTLALANEENFPHKGQIDFADLGVDPGTGTQLRRGVFPNPNLQLVPGLFVRLRLPIGAPEPKLLVSDRAVGVDQRGSYLLVVDSEGTVEYRPVKLGMSAQGGLRVVEQGIKPGDWVIVNGLQRARPGAKVSPKRTTQLAHRQAPATPIQDREADRETAVSRLPANAADDDKVGG